MKCCVLLEGSLAAICCRDFGKIPGRFNKCNGETGTLPAALSLLFITKCCAAKSAAGHFSFAWACAVKVV